MTQILDLIGALFILAGSTFTLIAAIGLVRFNDLFSRTHAAAKPQMLGLMLMLVGLMFMERTWAWFAICTLVIAIQMVAAPVASHLLGRAAYMTGLAESESLVLDELKEGDPNADAEEAPKISEGS
ncbi:monovalent cation/H(+) antiporter subunit G [Actinomycetaceae bacterium MB13-C1-2]|nr:monovalent cation/H(+) antiporter subunit G [Actinomycetaceae bacterium MB13-C1-2]